jgi:hypothetical protein
LLSSVVLGRGQPLTHSLKPTRPTAHRYTEVSNNKNPPEIYIRKFVKLTGHTYACNNLTNFAFAALAITGNGNYANLLKSNFKNS